MSQRPIAVRGLVIVGCGILLAIGGCLGFIATIETVATLAFVAGAGFVIGVLAVLAGAVVFTVGALQRLFGVTGKERK